MAHLWTLHESDDWTPRHLADEVAELVGGGAVLLRRAGATPGAWALLSASPALRLNGVPVPLGLAVLEDRDEIRLPDLTAWFSTETLAQVEPFPESITRGVCPRCKQAITAGSPAVRCPSCGLWHHESADLPCWTYAATCAGCAHETALDAGFRWTPDL